MSFLDPSDVTTRLASLLPNDWFPDIDDAPNLKAVLSMLAGAYSNDSDGLAQFLDYVEEQARIFTASGFWLDLTAQDYFGSLLQRHTGENDTCFRRRIILNLLAPRGTRPALMANVTNLTGFKPKIIELRNPGDCGAYSTVSDPKWGGAAYNELGAYGTMVMPYQLLIKVQRPRGEGIPFINGYSMAASGYATVPKPFGYVGGFRPPVNTYGTGEYVQLSDIIGRVTDQDIYDMVARTMPAGTTAWTAITSEFLESPPQNGGAMLGVNFYLDLSVLAASRGAAQVGSLGKIVMTMALHGTISIGSMFGQIRLRPTMAGILTTAAPITLNGTWVMPSMIGKGSIVNAPNKLILPLAFTQATIYTTDQQPLLPAVMPFILGTIPNAQPLIGQSFIVGQSKPGKKGGAVITPVETNCVLGDIQGETLPAALFSVSTPATASHMDVGGVGLSSEFTMPSVASVMQLGSLSQPVQPMLPATMPFTLGAVSQSSFGISASTSGVESATVIGDLTVPPHLDGLSSAAQAGVMSASILSTQSWNVNRTTSAITVSNVGRTATKTSGTSTDPIYAAKTATSGKYYWELTVSLQAAAQITAGIGNTSASILAGKYVGNDNNSLGWQASSGSVLENATALSTWPQWSSTGLPSTPTISSTGSTGSTLSFSWTPAEDVVTLCFACDLDNGMIYGRIAAGSWNGIAGGGTGGGMLTLGVTPLGQTSSSGTGLNILGTTPLGSVIPGQSSSTSTPLPSSPPGAPTLSTTPGTTTTTLTWTAAATGQIIPASVLVGGVSPACTLYAAGDSVVAAFAQAQWQFTPPDGYTAW